MVLMVLTEKLQNLCFIALCLLYMLYRPSWQFSLKQVTDCPSSKADWDKRANKANCPNGITYHCLLSVQGVLHDGCMRYQITNASAKGNCPQVRGVYGDFDFNGVDFNCTEDATVCPKIGSSYRSDELYKYPGCFGKRSVIQTTEKTTVTEQILKDTTYSTTNVPQSGLSSEGVAGIVLGSLFGIGLLAGIIGVILWRCNKCRIRKQTSSSVELSNDATQYSPVSQKEPNGVSNGSPLPVQESNGNANHTPDPHTRPGGDTNHTPDPHTRPGGDTNHTPDPHTRPGGDTNHTPDPHTRPGGDTNHTPDPHSRPGGDTNHTPDPHTRPGGDTNHTPDSHTRPGGDTNHTPDPHTRPGGDTNHTRVPQAEPNNRSNGSPHEVDGFPEADGGEEDVQPDTESMGTIESTGKGITIVHNYYKDCQFNNQHKHKFENPAAVQFGSGNTANICSASTDNGV